jgi:putative SOS response-associated peptidase YedK
MCSNYEPVTDNDRLLAAFGVTLPAGTDPAPHSSAGVLAPFIVRARPKSPDSLGEAKFGVFGLLPDFAKDVDFAKHTYLCRVESMKVKPAFKDSWWRGRRCVIPVKRISEWCYETPTRRPEMWGIDRVDEEPMGLAGLWSPWVSPTGERVLSFCMLTINADGHEVFGHMDHPDHEKRMPVILPITAQEPWLYGSVKDAERFLVRFPANQLRAAPLEGTARPLKEPPGWADVPDMFADEWRAAAVEQPRKKSAKDRPAMPPKPPELPGHTNGDLFG